MRQHRTALYHAFHSLYQPGLVVVPTEKSGDSGAIARGGVVAGTEMGFAATGPGVTPTFAMTVESA